MTTFDTIRHDAQTGADAARRYWLALQDAMIIINNIGCATQSGMVEPDFLQEGISLAINALLTADRSLSDIR